jgi:hypothetical protein
MLLEGQIGGQGECGPGRTAGWGCFESLSTAGDTALIARVAMLRAKANFSSIAAQERISGALILVFKYGDRNNRQTSGW